MYRHDVRTNLRSSGLNLSRYTNADGQCHGRLVIIIIDGNTNSFSLLFLSTFSRMCKFRNFEDLEGRLERFYYVQTNIIRCTAL